MLRRTVLAAAILLLTPKTSLACACSGVTGFELIATHAPRLVLAHVERQGKSAPGLFKELDVAYVDVAVVRLIRGKMAKTVVRVWDGYFGTSCAQDLRTLSPGAVILISLEAVKEEHSEMWDRTGIRPLRSDYLFEGGCAEGWRVFADDGQAMAYVHGLDNRR